MFLMFLLCSNSGRSWRKGVPILRDLYFTAAIDYQHVPGGKLLDAAKQSFRRRRGYESQIVIERFFVYFPRDRWMFQDGFDLRSKDEPTVLLIKVEGLDAGTIARQH